ncbi:MAG: 4-alpha-glucanotransferase [Dehalococcoidia bacterium]
MDSTGWHLLPRLARLYGVQTAYTDAAQQRREASPTSLLAVLQALGAPLASLKDVPSALRQRRQELWRQMADPVIVAWNGTPLPLKVRLPASAASATLVAHLQDERGEVRRWEWPAQALLTTSAAQVEGVRYIVKHLPSPGSLPWGYHRLVLELPGQAVESLIISAPLKAFTPPPGEERPAWGVFLPLYALHTRRGWGSGDYAALAALAQWVADLGGSVVATLPLLATFLEEPCHPSPYAPVSRLLWNEFYIDIASIPELQHCPEAQSLLASPSFLRQIDAFSASPLVDYRALMGAKRQVLETLARWFQAHRQGIPQRATAFHRFLETHPWVDTYARFRAVYEKLRTPWQQWPSPLRTGQIVEGDYDPCRAFYYQYVQWLAHQQMDSVAQAARQRGIRLLLDFPLGVHPDGLDTWKERDLFVEGASTGAPPDAFFSKGQNWGFPPLHPQRLRQQGYRYYIASLRHLLSCAGILRVDHVMGLHRLFWIPKGMEAKEGVYVRYPAEEFYAILALESQRHRVVVVGEDLGTVPPEVRPAMACHALYRSFVLQFQLAPSPHQPLAPMPLQVVASLNTHDMPPFAAFWHGDDIEDRHALGLLDAAGVAREKAWRQTLKKALVTFLQREGWLTGNPNDPQRVLEACLALLAHSPAAFLIVNLEDLWLERQPQNVPGTTVERPNWRRKARYSLEEFIHLPPVVGTLRQIALARPRT